MKEVKNRCLKLKKNNEIILMELFNLKEKMSRVNSINIEPDRSNEAEFDVIQERIRRVKLEISHKLQHIKSQRLLKDANMGFNSQKTTKKPNFGPVKLAMSELKDATEIINK